MDNSALFNIMNSAIIYYIILYRKTIHQSLMNIYNYSFGDEAFLLRSAPCRIYLLFSEAEILFWLLDIQSLSFSEIKTLNIDTYISKRKEKKDHHSEAGHYADRELLEAVKFRKERPVLQSEPKIEWVRVTNIEWTYGDKNAQRTVSLLSNHNNWGIEVLHFKTSVVYGIVRTSQGLFSTDRERNAIDKNRSLRIRRGTM